jgi:glycosyltransferase involved in cell wall biosynthesis
MRICYDYQIFAAQKYGGITRYFVEIASRIRQFPDTDVRILAPLYRSKLLREKRNVLPVVGTYFSGTFTRASGLCMGVGSIYSKASSRWYRPDIVHETYYSPTKTVTSATKSVITVHDMVAEQFPDPPSRPPGIFPARKRAFERADHLICVSQNTRADLIRLYQVDAAKVSVIPHGSSIIPSANPPLSIEDPFFLYVGSRWGYKNFTGLMDAFRQSNLYKSHRIICFGGDGFTVRELQRLHDLDLPLDRFEIIDGDDDLLSRYYASALALVYPSLYEGFGIPLLEAMECSCPVLCGNSSSLPEVAGDAASYFDAWDPSSIAEAMVKIANSPDGRELLIQRGKDRARQFSWDKCSQQTYAVYERLLSER